MKRAPIGPRGKEFKDEWWKIRNLVKPKIRNTGLGVKIKTWHEIKRKLKAELETKGFEATLKLAQKYLP